VKLVCCLGVTWQDRKKAVADLNLIYRAVTAKDAERQLREFETKWPSIRPSSGFGEARSAAVAAAGPPPIGIDGGKLICRSGQHPRTPQPGSL
jgi:hypothetical protein